MTDVLILIAVAVNTYSLKFLNLDILIVPLVMQSVFLGFFITTLGSVRGENNPTITNTVDTEA